MTLEIALIGSMFFNAVIFALSIVGFFVMNKPQQNVDGLLLRIISLEEDNKLKDKKITNLEAQIAQKEQIHKEQVTDLYKHIAELSIQLNEMSNGKIKVPGMINEGNERVLRERIVAHFNLEELKTLGDDIGIEYESLPNNLPFDAFVREFVKYSQKHLKTPILLSELKRQRPSVDWPGVI